MQTDDRAEFERILAEMFAALDKPLTEAKQGAFWKGLSRISLIEFSRCRDRLLQELSDGEPRKSFGLSDVWALRNRMRARAPAIAEVKWPGSQSLARVNLMFMRWLVHEIPKRKPFIAADGLPHSIPMAELKRRRQACIDLATAHEVLLLEDPAYATEAAMQRTFAEAMERIKRIQPDQTTEAAA